MVKTKFSGLMQLTREDLKTGILALTGLGIEIIGDSMPNTVTIAIDHSFFMHFDGETHKYKSFHSSVGNWKKDDVNGAEVDAAAILSFEEVLKTTYKMVEQYRREIFEFGFEHRKDKQKV